MGTLKAGRHGDLADSMAEAIATAMRDEWQAKHQEPLGALGEDDRNILFSAIARGVLNYLAAHLPQLETNRVVDTPPDGHRHHLAFTVQDP